MIYAIFFKKLFEIIKLILVKSIYKFTFFILVVKKNNLILYKV